MTKKQEACATCKYWFVVPPEDDAVNECRRNAPAGHKVMTKAKYWCGEYKKK